MLLVFSFFLVRFGNVVMRVICGTGY